MGFVKNLILFFRQCKNCANRLTFDKVITDYVRSVFMDHSELALSQLKRL